MDGKSIESVEFLSQVGIRVSIVSCFPMMEMVFHDDNVGFRVIIIVL